ncbi:hypothetical protein GGI24_002504 [Coemansia furcata]|nr:hypothetical protein GGI24_002504 [Coemansia furcata]
MNVDMDDSDAIRGPIRSNQSFDDVEQLALSMMGMGIHDNGAECVMIAELLRQSQELRSGTNGRMREELAEAKRQLIIERQRANDAQDELDEMTEKHEDLLDRNEWLEDRVNELETLSDRHRENIAGMQRSIQNKKELISDYEDRYGYIW